MFFAGELNDYRGYLTHGHMPPSNMHFTRFKTSLIINLVKYDVEVLRRYALHAPAVLPVGGWLACCMLWTVSSEVTLHAAE